MTSRGFTLTLLVAVATTLTAQQEAARPPARSAEPGPAPAAFDREQYRIPHTRFVLENGLTLIVHEDRSVPVVAVNLWYHVGSRNEQRGKTGFAHLFEHFFFNGSEHYPHGFREAMDDLGANNRNGTTSADRTNFFEDVPVSALERTLYLEADRMGFLAGHISKEMLERERGVVQNEKRQSENQPYGRVFSQMLEMLYPAAHPYSWPTIGSMADLQAASLDDVKEWYRTFYGPNNCVLSLAGDITPDRALALVKKYFDGIPPGPPLRRTAEWIPRLDRNLRDEVEDRVPQARLYRVYHAPAWKDPELQALGLAAGVLSGSKSARLDRRLVYGKDLATSVSAGVWEKELAGNVVIQVTLKAGVEPAAAERELDAALAELIAKGPTAAELTRAKTRDLADFVRGLERLGGFGGRSDVLAQSATFGGSPEAYLTRAEAMATATPEQVRAAAKKWLDAPHYTLVVRPYPRLSPGHTTLDRTVLPPVGDAPPVRFPEVQRTTLGNGLSVILLERHTAPIVNIALAVDAGFAADPPDQAGAASLALGLMDEGTTTRDAFRIVDELDALGARLSTGSSLDLSVVRLNALPRHLLPSLQLMADVVRNPAFPAELVALEKRRRLALIGQEKAHPTAAAMRVLPRLLYGEGHAYGRPATGSGYETTVEALSRDDLVAWHRTWFHPNHSTLIVTGDTSMEQLRPALEQAFGAWPRGAAPAKRVTAVDRAPGGKVYLMDRPDAQQSIIVAAHVTEPGGQPEDLALDTVIRNFGGIATSRLNRNLRLDKHWSYGATSVVADARGHRAFYVLAPVQSDRTSDAMVEVAREIRGVAGARPIEGEEFASIMRNQTLGLPGRFATLAALEGAAIDLINFGYPDDYFANYASNVRSLDQQALAAASARFIRPSEVIWIVIGDLKEVEAGIRALALGEIVHIDADGRPVGGATPRASSQ